MDLSFDRLTKHYGGKIAVDRVSATLTPGVYGLLGANGDVGEKLGGGVMGVAAKVLGQIAQYVPVRRPQARHLLAVPENLPGGGL